MKEEKINLMEKLFSLNMLLHRHHHSRMCGNGNFGDPNRGQGRILSILKMKQEISQKELSYLLDMRSQSLGELLSKLESSGHITRTLSQTDRRVMDIKLTDKGVEAAGEMEKNRGGSKKMLDCLSEDEQVKFAQMLDKIIDSLEKELGETDAGIIGEMNAKRERLREFFQSRKRGFDREDMPEDGFGGMSRERGNFREDAKRRARDARDFMKERGGLNGDKGRVRRDEE